VTGNVVLGPNAPLYSPSEAGILPMSVNYTVQNYLGAGVPPSKLSMGIALYGHSFYAPNLGAKWNGFGAQAQNSGLCCGPLKSTFGGVPGQNTEQCGTFMYSEIVAAGAQLDALNNETMSDVAYFTAQGADGYTPAGTWVTYTGPRSAALLAKYAVDNQLGSAFTFDCSMDTYEGDAFTFKLSNLIADTLQA
jgi:GH18 family chitinase